MFRKFIMNRPGLRNVALILGQMNNYTGEPGHFESYFEYKIGEVKDDYGLYFSRLPSAEKYYNYIFLKLWAYKPHDAIKYLEYHYQAYPGKKEFLLFLKRDLEFRINWLKDSKERDWLGISTLSLEWVTDQLREMGDQDKIQLFDQYIRDQLALMVRQEIQDKPLPEASQSIEGFTDSISKSLQERLDRLVSGTEERMSGLADQYETGDIQLANLNLKDKLIALLLCLKNLTTKPTRRNKAGDPLFTKMELNDIAQILRLHFGPYKGLKVDSIEKRIYEVNNNLKINDPGYQELNKALQKFFFN